MGSHFVLFSVNAIFTDSIIFRARKGAKIPLKSHPTAFGHFSNEIDENEEIKLVVCMSAKNYSYETQHKTTKEPAGRITKIKGLTLFGKVQEAMNTQRLLSFVEKVQQDEKVQEEVPQIKLVINGLSKRLSSKEIHKMYRNYSNEKRFYNSQAHPTKLWPYGTTSYDY